MKDFNSFIAKTSPRHEELNPNLWSGLSLQEGVKDAIESRAEDFISKLGLSPSSIEDLRIVGGNASYAWDDASDLDVTIMLNRNEKLTKEEVRRLGISASNLTYRLSPSINGIDLNFFIGHRNLGGIRPAKQSVYSLNKDSFLVGPGRGHEQEPNFLAGKANYFTEMIESCLSDNDDESGECAGKLLKKLKRYRLSGLKTKDGEYSTQSLVWRLLSRSGYIDLLKNKIAQIEKDYYAVKTPELINNNEYRMLVRQSPDNRSIPNSLIQWNKQILRGRDAMELITRAKPLIGIFESSI